MLGIGLEALGESRCWELLAASHVGRLAVCLDGQPVVLPVDYWLREHHVLVRTGAGTKAAAGARGARVALEVDDLSPAAPDGPWSVLVKGRASLLAGPEFGEALAVGPEPTVGGQQRLLLLRIEVAEVTGRRAAPPTPRRRVDAQGASVAPTAAS